MDVPPIPTHLRECFVPLEGQPEDGLLKGAIRCACGSEQFELRYPGQTQDWFGRQLPCTASIGGRYFFRLEAHCLGCGRDHLLLDQDFHGWNGFVCHDAEQAALPRPQLVPWPCSACGALAHLLAAAVRIETEEFILEEADDDIDLSRWYDAFGWFSVDLTCAQCGRTEEDLISCETM